MELTKRERALRAMWSQGHPEALLDCLSPERFDAVALLVDDKGAVSADVRTAVGDILAEHFAELKATTEETDATEETPTEE